LAKRTLKKPFCSSLNLFHSDVEVIPPLDGSPDGRFVWLIFETKEQAEKAKETDSFGRVTDLARQTLRRGGFPNEAARSLDIGFTSFVDIEEGGGRFSYFR